MRKNIKYECVCIQILTVIQPDSSAEVCIECYGMLCPFRGIREERIFGIFEFYLLDVWAVSPPTTMLLETPSIMYELNSFPDEYEIYSNAKHNIKISFDSIESESESESESEFLCLRQ